MVQSPEKPKERARKAECQAFVAIVACGPRRGVAGLELISQAGSASHYFLPFSVDADDPTSREYAYAGFTAAIDKLRSMRVDRVLIAIDDDVLVGELDRRLEPPKELFLHYVIAGCKLNEFHRARVISSQSTRLEQLRIRTKALASTIYQTTPAATPA